MNSETFRQRVEPALRGERPLRRVSPGFSGRVIDALPPRTDAAVPANIRPSKAWPRLVTAGGLAILALAGWVRFSPKPAGPEVAVTLKLRELVPPASIARVQALTANLDAPLEQEARLVLDDTRNALRFVASNFLPED